MQYIVVKNLQEWRSQARGLIAQKIPPAMAQFLDPDQAQDHFFSAPSPELPAAPASFKVSGQFVTLAEKIACHRDPQRWNLLYQALWSLVYEEKNLLKIASDPLINKLQLMQKAIQRDAHKAKAFVRFRLCQTDRQDHYIAWHNPDHLILPLVAPFFQRRFAVMRWTIMTADETVHWDGEALHFSPGVKRSEAPTGDDLEQIWGTYYRSTFNPARIKLDMMKREMPVRHWATLPETALIPAMLKEAEHRVTTMLAHQERASEKALRRQRHVTLKEPMLPEGEKI